MTHDDRPAIAPRPWREPHDVLMAIVAGPPEEAARLRPRLAWALRELRRRTWPLKRKPPGIGRGPYQPPWDLADFRDEAVPPALWALFEAARAGGPLDPATRERIADAALRIGTYWDGEARYREDVARRYSEAVRDRVEELGLHVGPPAEGDDTPATIDLGDLLDD